MSSVVNKNHTSDKYIGMDFMLTFETETDLNSIINQFVSHTEHSPWPFYRQLGLYFV